MIIVGMILSSGYIIYDTHEHGEWKQLIKGVLTGLILSFILGGVTEDP